MKTLKTISVSMMVLLVATFGLMAADSVNETADFTIGNSYDIRVISGSLGFGEDSSVGGVGESGSFTSNDLEVKLDHNYDVSITGTGSAFDLDTDTSDYSDPYAVKATWDVKYKVADDGSYSSLGSKEVSSPDTSKEVSYDANVDTTEGNVWTKIDVTADRNGLEDPSGTYTAEMDIQVSDLS